MGYSKLSTPAYEDDILSCIVEEYSQMFTMAKAPFFNL